MTPEAISEAPAKVNLYLHVTGRRADGLHELDSLVVFASIGDSIIARPAPEGKITLSVEGPRADGVPTGSDNLVTKAASLLAGAAGNHAGAAITLIKRLPMAAGIGGGSADAAATLKALIRLWDVDIPEPLAADIALKLGADVPVCLAGESAFISGVGEHIKRAPKLPPAWLVLANPGAPLSTPDVFAAREGGFSEPAPFSRPPADAGELAELLSVRGNDLAAAACRLEPKAGATLAALESQDGALLARMSGSGATCFALFAEENEAQTAAGRLASLQPDWWVAAAKLL